MILSKYVKERYTTKVFDPSFKLTKEQIDEIKTLLQYSPSSTNSQPWHFIIADSREAKEKIAKAATGKYENNYLKIINASHVIIFCSRVGIDDEYLKFLLDNEEKDGRFLSNEQKIAQQTGRSFYINMHRFEAKDLQQWTDKQLYIALGTLLLGASVLGIDACPMEGFDSTILNNELELRNRFLTASLLVGLGQHSENDFNKKLAKSRLPQNSIISEI